jgi:hypothetical protein
MIKKNRKIEDVDNWLENAYRVQEVAPQEWQLRELGATSVGVYWAVLASVWAILKLVVLLEKN